VVVPSLWFCAHIPEGGEGRGAWWCGPPFASLGWGLGSRLRLLAVDVAKRDAVGANEVVRVVRGFFGRRSAQVIGQGGRGVTHRAPLSRRGCRVRRLRRFRGVDDPGGPR